MHRLLEVSGLQVEFSIDGRTIRAVDDVSYHVNEGEIVAVVGESGSGKSVTQLASLQLIPTPPGRIVKGSVQLDGIDLLSLPPDSEALREVRGKKVGFIFQEPMTSLNPVLTVRQQIAEKLMVHLRLNAQEANRRVADLLRQVGIPDADHRMNDYPHQFSGGMRQRIMIAMALACEPRLLIADEATTALDVTTQAQILELLRDIVRTRGMSMILVTHNLGLVARYAERIYVMYAGRMVESGTCTEIFSHPRHPYTVGLLRAVPRLDHPKEQKLISIEGTPMNPADRRETCPFLPRCVFHLPTCLQKPAPALEPLPDRPEHWSACYADLSDEGARSQGTGTDPAEGRVTAATVAAASASPQPTVSSASPVLEVKDLRTYFHYGRGIRAKRGTEIRAVDGVSLTVHQGETLGLVGESGCGKTTVARTILRLYKPTSGHIYFQGQDLAAVSVAEMRSLRKNLTLIFQDPFSSLNPRQTAGSIVGEPLKIHRLVRSKGEYRERVEELFRMVGLDPRLQNRLPHEFSGGQRQRIGIARALASDPSFVICDEAISALDVSIQAQIINLLKDLQARLGITYLFISHDLSVVRHISDRVAVMYLGRVVEVADWRSIYENPLHPYTKALLSAIPIPDPAVEARRERIILRGEVPSLLKRPRGCAFHNRCPLAAPECAEEVPELRMVSGGHAVACWRSNG